MRVQAAPASAVFHSIVAVAAAGALAGCLLPDTPPPIRYFTPVAQPAPDNNPKAGGRSPSPRLGPALRVVSVSAAPHLRDRIVWRSEVELGFYEDWRWVAPPAEVVTVALERELFEVRGLRQATSGLVPILDVQVLAFEEVLGSATEARVSLLLILSDARGGGLLTKTIAAARPIPSDDPVDLARAIGAALDEAVKRTAGEVEQALSAAGSR